MNVALKHSFNLVEPRLDWSDPNDTVQFTVSFDMRTPNPPLIMEWTDFVMFALGAGVDPNAIAKVEERNILGSGNTDPCFEMSRVANGWTAKTDGVYSFHFSLRVALAAAHIMVLENDGTLYTRALRDRYLRGYDFGLESSSLFMAIDYPLIDAEQEYLNSETERREQIAAAFIWSLYCRTHMTQSFDHNHPYTNELVEIRDKCLYVLFLAEQENLLHVALETFLQNRENEDKICEVIHCYQNHAPHATTAIEMHKCLQLISEKVRKLEERTHSSFASTLHEEGNGADETSLKSLLLRISVPPNQDDHRPRSPIADSQA